jgi:hypothetical protein
MIVRRSATLVLALALSCPVGSYETDQFNNRQQDIEDSLATLNREVTLAIAHVIVELDGPRDEMKVVNGIYRRIGGVHWVDKLEYFAMDSSMIERLDTPAHDSIYTDHPLYATRVAGLFGVGPTIKLNGIFTGTDKLGHFLSQGRKFFRRWLKMGSEARAAEQSAFTERALFGQATTGSYSNADLVANYEGYRFYRGLFEDGFIDDKPAILAWDGDRWIMQRPFDWADHVNEYWDEALNINHYDKLLYNHMKSRLLTFCEQYRQAPELWSIENEEELKQRYENLQLRDTSELRLSNLCATVDETPGPNSETNG